MPELVPFRGLRFSRDHVPAGAEICPPYDVIDGKQHETLLAHHSHTAVRIVLGDDPSRSQGTPEEYRDRGAMVRAWVDEGVLVRDERPGYSLYEYEFTNMHGQRCRYRGVLGAARGKPWGEGVLRHEEIRPKVVDDRYSLQKESGIDSGVVQLVDEGLGDALAPYFDEVGTPVLDAEDFRGDRHRVWILDDPEKVATLREFLAPRPAVVADGHHRYTTALRLGGEDARPGAGHVLTVIGELLQEGLAIEPTHRILVLPEAEAIPAVIDRLCSLDAGEGEGWSLERANGEIVAGRTPIDLEQPTLARRFSSLWDDIAGLEIENWHDLEGARARLGELGERALLCVLPAVTRDEFWARCSQGEVFPPKTTYFEPKISTGMVLRLIEDPID
ncbi:MAG: DUF1015 family protein [Planctomycetota bacterium]